MQRKLTITVTDQVYRGSHSVVGRGRISQFIESLVRPHVVREDLVAAYQAMAAEEERESDALLWADATMGDVGDETR